MEAVASLAHGLALVRSQIVHDDDVAQGQFRRQTLFYIGQEAAAIDRAVFAATPKAEWQAHPRPIGALECRVLAYFCSGNDALFGTAAGGG